MSIIISELMIYPLKSLPGIAVMQMPLDLLGAEHDRRYMLVDQSGRFVSQRQYAQMALAQLGDAGDAWHIRLDGGGERLLPKEGRQQQVVPVNIWDDQVAAYDQGDDWADWFSRWLGAQVRLVYMPPQPLRPVDADYAKTPAYVGFADGFPLLLLGEASLQYLNSFLPFNLVMERFRPNIVVSGSKPFAEDGWRKLRAGDVGLDVVKPCSRCVIPTIDPQTAQKQREVWQMLQQQRRGEDGKIYVGQNVLHRLECAASAVLHIGQPLIIESYCD